MYVLYNKALFSYAAIVIGIKSESVQRFDPTKALCIVTAVARNMNPQKRQFLMVFIAVAPTF